MNFISFIYLLLTFNSVKPLSEMPGKIYIYLALGDSYTIGGNVSASKNFPNQTVRLLRSAGFDFQNPEIVAKTGWTTDELQDAINKHQFHSPYDFLTLLIGVNNQFRGRTVENYKQEFVFLLKEAISFAEYNSNHVIVLSIPDWSITPFAEGRNRENISKQIDFYNEANKAIAEKYKVHYIDITSNGRQTRKDLTLFAEDGLHPSAKEYSKWSEKLSTIIKLYL